MEESRRGKNETFAETNELIVKSCSNQDPEISESRMLILKAKSEKPYVLLDKGEPESGLVNRLIAFSNLDYKNYLSTFVINNSSIEIYRYSIFRTFVKNHSYQIRSLKLAHFFNCDSGIELSFFQYLTNLEELEITKLLVCIEEQGDFQPSRVPKKCLETLKVLKLGRVDFNFKVKRLVNSDDIWFLNPLTHCPNLETLMCPKVFLSDPIQEYSDENPLIKYIIKSLKDLKDNDVRLKYLDLASVTYRGHNRYMTKDLFEELIDICVLKRVKLLNVNAGIYEEIRNGSCINSVTVFCTEFCHRNFACLPLPNVEKIEVDTWHLLPSTSTSIPNLDCKKTWPNLLTIALKLRSKVSVSKKRGFKEGNAQVFEVVQLLMNSEPRPTVENIEIEFGKVEDGDDHRNCVTSPKIITAMSITNNFSNLISLSIIGWDTDDHSFVCLWSGLPLLKFLKIQDCSTASDDAFIGKASNEPTFLKLNRLRKLVLNFTYMPELTFRLFEKVLCDMELNELVLNSDSKYPKNVEKCIISLSKGKFAKQMDRLELDLKTFNNLPKDQADALKKRFKSGCVL